ncbi:MAG: hypothetical protein IPJ19_04910 [Planctomycetes bacterium]|nr:hypothetical protein [Planctomycetota bacterium]
MSHRPFSALRRASFVVFLGAPLGAQTTTAWEYVGSPGISTGVSVCTQLTFDPQGKVCVAYQDQTGLGGHAGVQRFDGTSWSSIGTPGQATIADAWYDPLRFDATGNLYLASRDYGVGGRLSVRRIANGASTWTSVGPNAASPDQAHYTALALDANGVPYAAFADRGTTPRDRPSVMRFNSSSGVWEFVGTRGITSEPSSYNTLAFDSQGVLYAAYADRRFLDAQGEGKATVMRYDPSSASWSTVGIPGFSPQSVANLVLAIDHHDHLYVAYYRFHDKLVVMRFDGASWVQVGGSASDTDRPAVESETWRQWLSLCFDSQDRPYIAYELFDLGLRAAVRRFDGAQWTLVGQHGFTPDVADYLALALDGNDVPYVAFIDGSQSRKVSVMRYAPSPLVYGTPSPNSYGCSVAIDATGDAGFSESLPFHIEAAQVASHHAGALLWSHAPASIPFASGTLYIQPPVHRSTLIDSGGTPNVYDCSGRFALDFNAMLATGNTGLLPGTYAFAQYWYRDAAAQGGSALSAGLRFRIDP